MNTDVEPFERDINDLDDVNIERELVILNNLLHQIDHRIEKLFTITDSNNIKLEMLEDAISHITYLPYLPANPRFDHKSKELVLQKGLKIQFKGNEADLLSIMFAKTTGKAKKKIFYCAEVAAEFKKSRNDIQPAKAIHQTITRIQKRLRSEYRLENLITINTKEFYINTK